MRSSPPVAFMTASSAPCRRQKAASAAIPAASLVKLSKAEIRTRFYLSAAAQAVLATLPRVEGNPHSIAGAKDGAPRADLKKPWAAARKGARDRGRAASRLAALIREHRRGRVHGPACHRKATRTLSGRHHASLCPFRRGPAASCGRHYWRDDLGRDVWGNGQKCRSHVKGQIAIIEHTRIGRPADKLGVHRPISACSFTMRADARDERQEAASCRY